MRSDQCQVRSLLDVLLTAMKGPSQKIEDFRRFSCCISTLVVPSELPVYSDTKELEGVYPVKGHIIDGILEGHRDCLVRYTEDLTFGDIQRHLPRLSPTQDCIDVILKNEAVVFAGDVSVNSTVICEQP